MSAASLSVPDPFFTKAAGDQFQSAETSARPAVTVRSGFALPVTSATSNTELSVPVPRRLKNDEAEIVEAAVPLAVT